MRAHLSVREALIRTRPKYISLIGAPPRKLAGIMFAVWRDGTEFDPRLPRPGGAPASPGAA